MDTVDAYLDYLAAQPEGRGVHELQDLGADARIALDQLDQIFDRHGGVGEPHHELVVDARAGREGGDTADGAAKVGAIDEPADAERVLDGLLDDALVEGLGEPLVGDADGRVGPGVHVSGDGDANGLGRAFLDLFEEGHALDLGHLGIRDDDVVVFAGDELQCVLGGAGEVAVPGVFRTERALQVA